MKTIAEKIIALLNTSYSVYHVVSNLESLASEHGYKRLSEDKRFILENGGKYYVTRNGSSFIAFSIPKNKVEGIRIAATHNDSPTFKVKPNPILEYKNLLRLNVEPYGGMIMSTWLDRPLSIAGRIQVRKDQVIEERLINIDEDLLSIPNVAIHMNRTINDGFKFNPAVDLLPVLGEKTEDFSFEKYLSEKASLKEDEKLIGHDLYLYVREKAVKTGLNREFLSASREDDLTSAYTVANAFFDSDKNDDSLLRVFVSFDNEEVGSLTRQGANSDFLKDTLDRVLDVLKTDMEEKKMIMASSFLISADNAHANHPNHPELSDPNNDVMLNKGIVIKYNANQSYTSDSRSSSFVKLLAFKAQVPYQEFTNRSDLRGGSTLGNISNSEVSLTSADIGLPQLAMHSSFELGGVKDLDYMYTFIKCYYDLTTSIDEKEMKIK